MFILYWVKTIGTHFILSLHHDCQYVKCFKMDFKKTHSSMPLLIGRFCHSFQSKSQNATFLDVFPSRLRIDFFQDILKQTCIYEFMKSSCKPKQTFWNYANYKSNRTSYSSVTWKRKGIKAEKKNKNQENWMMFSFVFQLHQWKDSVSQASCFKWSFTHR